MEQLDIEVLTRTKNSKNGNRRARRDGHLPAVIYGAGQPPQPILIDRTLFGKMLHKLHSSTILNLKTPTGEAERTIIREIQRDPVRDEPIHIDFLRIRVDVPIIVDVPIHAVGGTPKGVREGGVLETLARHISIKVLPLEVPGSIDHDLTNMEIGDAIHVSDLVIPQGVEVLTPEDATVFILAAPKTAEAEPVAGEEGAPEIVGEPAEKSEE
jgi:large subunit ribosomal protein L25